RSQGEEDGDVGAGDVRNPMRYEKQLREDIEQQKKNIPKMRAARFVMIRERDDNKEARQFLYQQYKGDCQVTGQTFAKSDGVNYFVAVALVPYQGTEYLNQAGNLL